MCWLLIADGDKYNKKGYTSEKYNTKDEEELIENTEIKNKCNMKKEILVSRIS